MQTYLLDNGCSIAGNDKKAEFQDKLNELFNEFARDAVLSGVHIKEINVQKVSYLDAGGDLARIFINVNFEI